MMMFLVFREPFRIRYLLSLLEPEGLVHVGVTIPRLL